MIFSRIGLPSADVIVFGRVLHNWDLATKKMLLAKGHQAPQSRGAVIVYDMLIDDDRRSHAELACFPPEHAPVDEGRLWIHWVGLCRLAALCRVRQDERARIAGRQLDDRRQEVAVLIPKVFVVLGKCGRPGSVRGYPGDRWLVVGH